MTTIKIVYLDGTERIIDNVIYWHIPAFTIPGALLIQVKTEPHGPGNKEYELYIVDQNDISFFTEEKTA